jgi:hypothetical protein
VVFGIGLVFAGFLDVAVIAGAGVLPRFASGECDAVHLYASAIDGDYTNTISNPSRISLRTRVSLPASSKLPGSSRHMNLELLKAKWTASVT